MSQIRGWCPGALRPMETGDGLLVRLRIPGGILSFENAHAIAGMAQQFGNGHINLSARANLQIRGVALENHDDLISELRRLKLVEANAEAEAVRNVIASPLAGNRAALIDIRPVVAALEQRLSTDADCWKLPGKFGFLIEDGGAPGLGDVSADVRFEAVMTGDGVRFGLALAGIEALWFGLWGANLVPDVAMHVAGVFIAARKLNPHLRRMRDFTAEHSGKTMLSEASPRRARAPAALTQILGAQTSDNIAFVGAAVPFGFLDAAGLRFLAREAEAHDAQDLRLTPWRSLLANGLTPQKAEKLAKILKNSEFIVDTGDPRLHVAACPGAPACSSGQGDAAQEALNLAPLLRGATGVVLHVSGCAKGCAHPAPAPFTLVGRNGLYDLVENGRASDPPVLAGLAPHELTNSLTARIQTFLRDNLDHP